MRHFYGYERPARDVPADMDRVCIDGPTTGRQERDDMMLSIAHDDDWPDGHDVYVVSLGDLGRGAEAAGIRRAIEREGNRLHVLDAGPKPDRRGRPRDFDPTPEQDAKIRALYHSFNAMRFVLDRVEQIMGARYEAHHLKRQYGNRWKQAAKEG